MDCQTLEMPDKRMRPEWLRSMVQRLLAIVHSSSPKLDMEVMSDYMKRDLGFLDGRGSRKDSDMTG